ncbi:hypothetical protein EV13_2518 [Prochlorococcus sp. MIT 0702]|nr:hypothetical protein EV12_2305 [Prochlorococcus sp. MIT 0701]KGG26384.1 hypothetical protein EV13_2518 [Prochlorococcus sp. MIT 0702]KGG31196.1 hypothetical protein EV14_2567 [Prochlorococcus sp. MIT 0703]
MALGGTSMELMIRWAKLIQRNWQGKHVRSEPFRHGSISWLNTLEARA